MQGITNSEKCNKKYNVHNARDMLKRKLEYFSNKHFSNFQEATVKSYSESSTTFSQSHIKILQFCLVCSKKAKTDFLLNDIAITCY